MQLCHPASAHHAERLPADFSRSALVAVLAGEDGSACRWLLAGADDAGAGIRHVHDP